MGETTKFFSEGTTVLIELGLRSRKRYQGTINERDQDFLYLTVSKIAGRRIKPGSIICLHQDADEITYIARVRVLAVEDRKSMVLLKTQIPRTVESLRARRYCRVDTRLPILVNGVPGRIVNLSATGALVLSAFEGLVDEEVELKFKLAPDTEPLEVDARIVRIEETLFGKQNRAAMDFLDISQKQQEAIIKYILETQRKYLQKGTLLPDSISHRRRPF